MIYEYNCPDCQNVFEVVKRLSEIDRVEVCPQCSGTSSTRAIGAPGFTTSENLGRKKAPEEFRSFLRTLHKNTPGSQMDVD